MWEEIRKDLISSHQMVRLLQGDVGSGKTIIALLAILQAIESGFQTAMMVPTSILARQHFNNIQILRPLFSYTKKEILNYAKTNKLFWIDDPSNKINNFSRTKIRSVIANAYKEKKIINKEYKNLNNLYLSYVRMINS